MMNTAKKLFYHPTKGIALKGIIFDMDGTLTKPVLNFKLMRSRLGIPEGQDVLKTVNTYDMERKAQAMQIIDEIEVITEEGRQKLELQEGIHALMEYLEMRKMRRAIVTRNSIQSIDHFIQKLGIDHFNPKITRDFDLPYKPDPQCSIHICKEWSLDPKEVMFVGDFKDDLVCGNSAGNVSCLINNHLNEHFREFADLNIKRLDELVTIIEQGFEINAKKQ